MTEIEESVLRNRKRRIVRRSKSLTHPSTDSEESDGIELSNRSDDLDTSNLPSFDRLKIPSVTSESTSSDEGDHSGLVSGSRLPERSVSEYKKRDLRKVNTSK